MLAILDFTRTRIGTITDYEDLEIEHDLENGDKTISFRYLGTDIIKNEYYVETDKARFTIKEVAPDESGSEYHGQLDLEDLQRVPFKRFTSKGQTLQAAAEAALQGTGWTVQTNITTIRNVQRYKVTPLEALYSIRDAWMCEISFDNLNNVVTFAEKIGEDKGVYFMRGINLREVSPNYDSYDYVTRLIPYGADGLTIESVNDGIAYVENYQYSTKVLTMIWEDTSYEDAQSLKDDAVKKLADLSKPKKAFDCEVINLAKESTSYNILDYNVGDTIHLIDDLTGTDELQRIVKYVEHPHAPEEDTCEISNTVLTFEELQDRMQKAADAWEEISNSDGTVNGVYVHGVEMDNIVGIEVLIGDGLTTNGAVANVAVMYAQGDSPTSAPSSGWSTTAPTWDDGKYMWQKTVTTYVNGESEETAVTNITGASGQPGANGSGFAWNILKGTKTLTASDFTRIGAIVSDGILTINTGSLLANYARYITSLGYDDYTSGTYTLSFDGREINDGSTATSGPITVILGYFNDTEWHSNFSPSRDKYKTVALDSQGEDWQRYSVTFTIPDDLDTGTDAAMVSGSQLQFQFQRQPKKLPFQIKDIKLELGSANAPGWAPHPDDIKGADGLSIICESSQGLVFKNEEGSTTITARIYQGGTELDPDGTLFTYSWSMYDKSGTKDTSFSVTDKSFEISADEVDQKATFAVEVSW